MGAAASDRDTELAQDRRSRAAAVKRMRTKIEAETVAQMSDGAAAEVAPFLEEGDGPASARQEDRRGQTGEPAADNDDILSHEPGSLSRAAQTARDQRSH